MTLFAGTVTGQWEEAGSPQSICWTLWRTAFRGGLRKGEGVRRLGRKQEGKACADLPLGGGQQELVSF